MKILLALALALPRFGTKKCARKAHKSNRESRHSRKCRKHEVCNLVRFVVDVAECVRHDVSHGGKQSQDIKDDVQHGNWGF